MCSSLSGVSAHVRHICDLDIGGEWSSCNAPCEDFCACRSRYHKDACLDYSPEQIQRGENELSEYGLLKRLVSIALLAAQGWDGAKELQVTFQLPPMIVLCIWQTSWCMSTAGGTLIIIE